MLYKKIPAMSNKVVVWDLISYGHGCYNEEYKEKFLVYKSSCDLAANDKLRLFPVCRSKEEQHNE